MSDKFSSQYESVSSQNYGKFAQKVEVVKGVPAILRFLDLPNGFMSYFESWILCDDDTKRPFIIKNEVEKSILYDIIGDRDNFYRGGFLESTINPKTRKPHYAWQMKDPELFNLVMYNNNLSNADGSWKSRQQYSFNTILRNPTIVEGKSINWCVENKHSMLLTLIPSAFKALGDLRILYGNPSEYDVVYIKSGTGFDTIHGMSKGDPMEFREVYIGELSDEEKVYGRYDLKKETAITSASKILERLGQAIERLSSVMGIDWVGQLEAKAAEDATDDGVNIHVPAARTVATGGAMDAVGSNPNFQNISIAEEVQPVSVQPAEVPPVVVAPAIAPAVQPVTPAPVVQAQVQTEQVVVAATPVTPRPIRVPLSQQQPQVQMESCFYCNAQIPAGSANCGQCGNVLMEPCTVPTCNKLFHVSLNTCPHCGEVYGVDVPQNLI